MKNNQRTNKPWRLFMLVASMLALVSMIMLPASTAKADDGPVPDPAAADPTTTDVTISTYEPTGASAAALANILLLADTPGAGTPALVSALTGAGYSVTVFAPEYNWNGSPVLAGFQCVIHLNGQTFNTPLPVSSQTALVNYVQSGNCFVGTQWDGYERYVGSQTAMNDLVLQLWPGSQTSGLVTLTTVAGQAGHPVLAGIPSPVLVDAGLLSPGAQVIFGVNPSTVLMHSPSGEPAVLVRNFGNGCVVNFASATNYTGAGALNDPTIQRLFVNAINWGTSAGCANNQPPTVAANSASVTVNEGQTAPNTGTVSDPDGNPVTLTASVGTVINNNDGTWSWSFVTSDGPDESQTVTISANDGNGGTAQTTFNLIVNNVAPSVAANNDPVTVNEGDAATNTGTVGDPGADTVSLSASVGTVIDNGNGTWSWSFGTTDGPADSQTVTITATDSDGASSTATFALVVNNVAPTLGAISVDQALVPVNTAINASASFTDPGTLDTHTAVWDWGDGTTAGTVAQGAGFGSVNDSHSYSTPGVYTIKLIVTDNDGAPSNESVYQYVVVFDPSAGFVTGGGWINSPAGAYAPDPSLTGKANFGFVAKYKNGQSIPDGNTEFQFKAGDLNFHSSSYEWLVVAGARGQFKGLGTINGTGNYGFMLTAIDGQINGGGGTDKFRIKIWNIDNGDAVVYDNLMGGADDAVPTTALGGGSIVIHK